MNKQVYLQTYGYPYVALAQDGAGAAEEIERAGEIVMWHRNSEKTKEY